jgi:hypothetical protein
MGKLALTRNFDIDLAAKDGVKSCVCLTVFRPFWAVHNNVVIGESLAVLGESNLSKINHSKGFKFIGTRQNYYG